MRYIYSKIIRGYNYNACLSLNEYIHFNVVQYQSVFHNESRLFIVCPDLFPDPQCKTATTIFLM